ncbi:MAG: flagellar hook-basal body complex protein FliE [Fimbriimonadia bacterium]|nr:flagellar hook-basal body complex protein FliE [Fimbriimonadia bacterium]
MKIPPWNPKVDIIEKPLKEAAPVQNTAPEADFGAMLSHILSQVNGAGQVAADLQQRYAAGEPIDEHTLMMAMERASLATQLTLQVRNRVLEAYQEVMRLQI